MSMAPISGLLTRRTHAGGARFVHLVVQPGDAKALKDEVPDEIRLQRASSERWQLWN